MMKKFILGIMCALCFAATSFAASSEDLIDIKIFEKTGFIDWDINGAIDKYEGDGWMLVGIHDIPESNVVAVIFAKAEQ